MLAQQAKAERDEFLKVIDRQRLEEDSERRMDLEKHASLRVHSQAIKDQILMNSETKKQQKLDYLEEGRKVRQKLEEEKMKVEGIKQRKLGELKKLGIHDKYQHDLAKKKIQ